MKTKHDDRLVQDSDGRFYGTAEQGGTDGAATIFRLTIVPKFQAVTLANNTLSLTWSTEAGGTYQLQSGASRHCYRGGAALPRRPNSRRTRWAAFYLYRPVPTRSPVRKWGKAAALPYQSW
jgi:hypothetical protein